MNASINVSKEEEISRLIVNFLLKSSVSKNIISSLAVIRRASESVQVSVCKLTDRECHNLTLK